MKKAVLTLLLILASACALWALDKDEILVVYNAQTPGAKVLSEYYMQKRGIPAEHLLGIEVFGGGERIDHAGFVKMVQTPIKAWLNADAERAKKTRCVLLMRGLPLAIDRIDDPDTRKALEEARREMRKIEAEMKALTDTKAALEARQKNPVNDAAEITADLAKVEAQITETDIRLKAAQALEKAKLGAFDAITKDTNASVDSELAVMYTDNLPLKRWVRNMLNYNTWNYPNRGAMPKVYMVCRLDAPTEELVRRMIDDAIAVEETGLDGAAYFDARGMRIAPQGNISAYAAYDELIRRAAKLLQDKTDLKVVLDDQEALFAPDTCPNAALYCGWYSLARYVPAFKWVRGSVGYHIASAEAVSLRNGEYWCKRMIEGGVAATFGPVGEPYLQSFPDPSHFFAFLLTGKYTLCEAFWYTKPYNSWQLTLIGDPLYNPFKAKPRMTIDDMKEALKPKPIRPPAPQQPGQPQNTPDADAKE